MATREAPVSLARCIEGFFRERLVAQRRASRSTLAAYRDGLRLLLIFCSQRSGKRPTDLTFENMGRDAVLAFLDHLEEERGNAIRSRNARLAAIRSFFQYVSYCAPDLVAHAQQILAIPSKRAPRAALKYLSDDEVDALLMTPDRTDPMGFRDYVLMLFLVRTGARVSEAVGVNRRDLRLEGAPQVLLRGKGSKERVIPIAAEFARVLAQMAHIRHLAPHADAPVFLNARGARLSRFGVIHILDGATTAASCVHPTLAGRSISPHTLRHTCAMQLLQAGVDLATIQAWLGHSRVDTTHWYAEANLEMKRRALEQCPVVETLGSSFEPDDALLQLLEQF